MGVRQCGQMLSVAGGVCQKEEDLEQAHQEPDPRGRSQGAAEREGGQRVEARGWVPAEEADELVGGRGGRKRHGRAGS